MTSFTRWTLTAMAVLVFATVAFGQWRDDDYRNRGNRYYDRDDYGGRYGRQSLGLIDRVIADIDRAGYYGQSGGDRHHLDHARNDLYRFREKWYGGKFDRGRLDSAIDNIHHVVDSRRVDPRERSSLTRDMYELRDFRATGGYENRGPYPR